MTYWIDIAAIVFTCTTMNHLGLISAVEGIIKRSLPVLNCPKCSTFWLTLAYSVCSGLASTIPLLLAISFLASYLAIWLELLEGFIDSLYTKLYEIIYQPTDDTAATADNKASTDGSVPYVQ